MPATAMRPAFELHCLCIYSLFCGVHMLTSVLKLMLAGCIDRSAAWIKCLETLVSMLQTQLTVGCS